MSYAKQVGFEVVPYTDESDGVQIYLGRGEPVRTVGRVKFTYVRHNKKAISGRDVVCEVCDSYSWDFVILGDPFLEIVRSIESEEGGTSG